MRKKTVIIVVAIIVAIIFIVLLFILAMIRCHGVGGFNNGAYIYQADCGIRGPLDIFRIIHGNIPLI